MFLYAWAHERTKSVSLDGVDVCFFRKLAIGFRIVRNLDRTGYANIQLMISYLPTDFILFFAAGPPWEWPSYRRLERGEIRIAGGLLGMRVWYPGLESAEVTK